MMARSLWAVNTETFANKRSQQRRFSSTSNWYFTLPSYFHQPQRVQCCVFGSGVAEYGSKTLYLKFRRAKSEENSKLRRAKSEENSHGVIDARIGIDDHALRGYMARIH
jgi:hypothetical protein